MGDRFVQTAIQRIKERQIHIIRADKYNKMILKIKQPMLELSQKEKNLRYLEFNDSKKVISLTKPLTSFFRVSLNNGQKLASVGEVIEYVKQYLYIQKERYEDKLTYHITQMF